MIHLSANLQEVLEGSHLGPQTAQGSARKHFPSPSALQTLHEKAHREHIFGILHWEAPDIVLMQAQVEALVYVFAAFLLYFHHLETNHDSACHAEWEGFTFLDPLEGVNRACRPVLSFPSSKTKISVQSGLVEGLNMPGPLKFLHHA